MAIDSATPIDEAGPSGGFMDPAEAFGGYGPMRSYGRLYGSLDFDDVSIVQLCAGSIVWVNLKRYFFISVDGY